MEQTEGCLLLEAAPDNGHFGENNVGIRGRQRLSRSFDRNRTMALWAAIETEMPSASCAPVYSMGLRAASVCQAIESLRLQCLQTQQEGVFFVANVLTMLAKHSLLFAQWNCIA